MEAEAGIGRDLALIIGVGNSRPSEIFIIGVGSEKRFTGHTRSSFNFCGGYRYALNPELNSC